VNFGDASVLSLKKKKRGATQEGGQFQKKKIHLPPSCRQGGGGRNHPVAAEKSCEKGGVGPLFRKKGRERGKNERNCRRIRLKGKKREKKRKGGKVHP